MLLNFLLCYSINSDLQIKHASADLYICDTNTKKEGHLSPEACREPTTFKVTSNDEGYHIIENTQKKQVFDIENNNSLIFYPHHGNINQQFEFRLVNKDKYLIVNRNKCVSFDGIKRRYMYKECNSGDNQLFELIFKKKRNKKSSRSEKMTDDILPIYSEDSHEKACRGKYKELVTFTIC